jgi:hypothetical protein
MMVGLLASTNKDAPFKIQLLHSKALFMLLLTFLVILNKNLSSLLRLRNVLSRFGKNHPRLV